LAAEQKTAGRRVEEVRERVPVQVDDEDAAARDAGHLA
jgi:hypothetical protein